MKEKRGRALFAGQYFCSSITCKLAASYSAALPGCMLLCYCRNRCGDTIIAPLNPSAYCMCLHAHVGVHVTHICTCVLECLRVSPPLTHRAGVKSSSDKLIISSLEERWLTEREAVNQHLMVEQKPRNDSRPSRDRGASFWIKKLGFHPQLDVKIIISSNFSCE